MIELWIGIAMICKGAVCAPQVPDNSLFVTQAACEATMESYADMHPLCMSVYVDMSAMRSYSWKGMGN